MGGHGIILYLVLPNHALQRTRPSRSGCNPRVPRAGSLSLGRYRDMKLHSILFGWSDPDQALRVAAGIPGKRASDGLWPSGQYCQGCEAFPTMYRTWEPPSGVGLEHGQNKRNARKHR